jgi:hypothetical protein
MDLERAIETIEYKIATESDSFNEGRTIKMDVTRAWPPIIDLSDALQRRYPSISLCYDEQANDVVRLIITNKVG